MVCRKRRGLRAEPSGAGTASQPLSGSGTWAADCFSELVSSLVECEYTHPQVIEGKVPHMKGPSMVSGLSRSSVLRLPTLRQAGHLFIEATIPWRTYSVPRSAPAAILDEYGVT